jgi:hypothetical protein
MNRDGYRDQIVASCGCVSAFQDTFTVHVAQWWLCYACQKFFIYLSPLALYLLPANCMLISYMYMISTSTYLCSKKKTLVSLRKPWNCSRLLINSRVLLCKKINACCII